MELSSLTAPGRLWENRQRGGADFMEITPIGDGSQLPLSRQPKQVTKLFQADVRRCGPASAKAAFDALSVQGHNR